MSSGVTVFLGKKDIRSLDIIQSFTKTFHMPYLSPSLSEDTAQDEEGGFEIHMKPPHTQAIIDLILHFGWTRVHYLYDSDEGKLGFMPHIKKNYVTLYWLRNKINNANILEFYIPLTLLPCIMYMYFNSL